MGEEGALAGEYALGRVGPRRPPVKGACRSVRLKVAAQARSSAHPPDRRPRLQTDAAHPRTQCKVSTQPRFEFTFITCVLHLTTSWCVRTEYNKTKMIEDEYGVKIRLFEVEKYGKILFVYFDN